MVLFLRNSTGVSILKRFSKDMKVKNEGLRQAQNIPIQGSGADIVKLAMIRIHKRLQELESRMVLTIHDELVFEVPKNELELVQQIVIDEMEHVVDLVVPLPVDVGMGASWYETKN